jgi:hypothetical protein
MSTALRKLIQNVMRTYLWNQGASKKQKNECR